MKSNSPKKKRVRISRKKFEEKVIAGEKYSDKVINLEEDPFKINPEYYEEEGINPLQSDEENDPLNEEF